MTLVGQLLRFGSVGGLATLIHVVVALFMGEIAGLVPLQANLAGFACAILFSYLGHARFTFARPVARGDQFLRFVISGLVSLGSSSLLVWVLTQPLGVDFAIAMLAVGGAVPVLTYLVLRFWVFEQGSDAGTTDWGGLALCAAMPLMALVVFWDRPINHDTAWYLVATREWLGGSALYTHLLEVNPPLNFYFTLPAIGLAELFGLSDKNGEYLALSLLIFGMLCWSRKIIASGFDLSSRQGAFLLMAIAAALIVPALHEFGQREHVLVILTLPWLLWTAGREAATPRQETARAAVAALGVCLKPHFALIPIAVILLDMVRQKSLRPLVSASTLTFLAVGIGYVGFVLIVHPAYLTDVVPMALEIYGAYGAPTWLLLYQIAIPLLLGLTVAFAALRASLHAAPFLAVSFAGLVIYLVQGTGFHYHAIPFKTYLVIACAIMVATSRQREVLVYTCVVAGVGILALEANHGFYKNSAAQEIVRTATDHGDIDSMMVFTTHVSLGPAVAMESGAAWASRYPANWLVPGAHDRLSETDCVTSAELCARLESYARRNRQDNIADINSYLPEMMVFERSSGYFKQPGFSWVDFMAKDPAWAEIMGRYEKVKVTDLAVYMTAIK